MDYSFVTQTSEGSETQNLKYEFVVDDKGIPRKLGDGTYGSVFEVKGPGNTRCAVKLFYPVKDKDDITEMRNRSEMHSGVNVREELEKSNNRDLISKLVLSEAWTSELTKSCAHKNLEEQFKKLGVAVSDNALVMPYYECTLKDVLEIGAPAGRRVRGETEEHQGRPGYEILRSLTVAERERQILCIIGQIVVGLRALHAAGLYHHDIKPANVMMKNFAPVVEVALGDFGFLETNLRSREAGYEAGLPLGTRHYRSPEQKDYFDVCDVKVIFDEKNRHLVLETSDRKFRDTLIEKGDIAEFSKDSTNTGYTVEEVKHQKNGKSQIILQSAGQQESEDEKTQVMFYKKPSPRTDIFGVGAILFDLLTGGKSPECFYDYLRHKDHTEGDQVNSVNHIIEDYRAATNTHSTSADLASLFEQIRDEVHNRYPSPEIVSVLLRCMLSRASDSYYEKARTNGGEVDRQKLFLDVYTDLTALVDEESILTTMLDSNPLWVGKSFGTETTETTPSILSEIEKIRKMSLDERMLWGTLRFRQLVKMVDRNREQGTFFYNIRPGNLRFNNTDIVPVVSRFKAENDYLRAVRSGSASRTNAGANTDNYTPVYEKFHERSVEVKIKVPSEEETNEGSEEESNNSEDKTLKVKVRYTESMPIWRGYRKGDLLRIIDSRGRPQLCQIVDFNLADTEQEMKIEEVTILNDESDFIPSYQEDTGSGDINTITDLAKMEKTRGVLGRRLIPMSYYLSILATYIQHLFFTDEIRDDGTIPDIVWSALLEYTMTGKFPRVKESSFSSSQKPDSGLSLGNIFQSSPSPKGTTVEDVRSLLASIYLELIHRAESCYEQGVQAEDNLYARLLDLADKLDDAVAQLYNMSRNELRALSAKGINDKNLPSLSSNLNDKAFSEYLRDLLN